MTSETPQSVEGDDAGGDDRLKPDVMAWLSRFEKERDDAGGDVRSDPVFTDVAVVGRRGSFVDILATVLFAGVPVAVVVKGDAGIVLYLLIPIILLTLWTRVMSFIRRPRAAIEEGVFSLRLLPTWRTPATNVASLELRAGKVNIAFHEVDAVQPKVHRSAMSGQFKKHGYHLETGRGVFSLEQVNALRAALEMPVQEQDQFADFQATLNGLTPRVIVTPTFIAANVIVFLLMALTGVGIFQANVGLMIGWGANYGPLTSTGEWWRLLTSTFLHFGAIHLLVNMWVLRDIGQAAERLVGNVGFALAYLISGFFGSLASVFWHESAVSAGASGAVFGVFGMVLGYMALHKRSIPAEVIKEHRANAIAFLIFNVVFGISIPWIDQAAHIGGFLAGCLCGLVLGCDLSVAAVQRKFRNLTLAASTAMIGALAVVVLPPPPPDLVMIGVRIDKVDAAAIAIYEKSVNALQSGEQPSTEAAVAITASIVPRYVELAASLEQVQPQDEEQKRVKLTMAKYIQLRREGWELLAEAAKKEDFVREGLAVEKFEAAMTALAEIKPGTNKDIRHPTDLRTEAAVFSVAEARAFERYHGLMQRFSRGDLNDSELAESIERDVLPVWQDSQKRFVAAAKRFTSQDQRVVSRVDNYLKLQREAWLLQVEALREHDEDKAAQSIRELEAAGRAGEAIWQASPAQSN